MSLPTWMKNPADRLSELPMDVQSRGRSLSEAEQHFADALESIFTDGCHDFEQVAARLSELEVKSPSSGASHWTLDSLTEELRAINAQLDSAFEEHGYGA